VALEVELLLELLLGAGVLPAVMVRTGTL